MIMATARLLDVVHSTHPDGLPATVFGILTLVEDAADFLPIDVDLRLVTLVEKVILNVGP
jgi:hypothetical protein